MVATHNLYIESEKRDFNEKFLATPNAQGYWLRGSDGKLDHHRRPHPNPPWYYHKATYIQNCNFWHKILFNVLHGQKKVPIWCQKHCWKIVVAPRNIEELFFSFFVQRELDVASKCGIEGDRINSDKLYGAYWYNHSINEGHYRYKQVKEIYQNGASRKGTILDVPVEVNLLTAEEARKLALPEEVPIILKRACTEFEQHCGPSENWTWDEDQEEFERLALDAFVPDQQNFKQNEYQLGTLFMRWIHRAYSWGDKSYLKFTEGNELFATCQTFHDRPEWRPNFPNFQCQPKEVTEDGQERTRQRAGSGVELHQDQRQPASSVDIGAERSVSLQQRTEGQGQQRLSSS